MNARSARNLLGVIALAYVLATGQPKTADAADATVAPLEIARAFVNAMNAGDVKAADATFAAGSDLTDDFSTAPLGRSACDARLGEGIRKLLESEHMTEPHIAVVASKFASVSGTHAYLPLPTEFSFKQNDTVTKEHGILTFVLDHIGATWKIRSMSWRRIS